MDRALIEEVRNTWQFYRDRRPETYGAMVEMLPDEAPKTQIERDGIVTLTPAAAAEAAQHVELWNDDLRPCTTRRAQLGCVALREPVDRGCACASRPIRSPAG
jgi:hypothetical protein